MFADSDDTLLVEENKPGMYWRESLAHVLFAATPIFIAILGAAAGILMLFASPLQCVSPDANNPVFSKLDNFCFTQICKENENDSWVDSYIKFPLDSPCDSTCAFIPVFLILVALLFAICVILFYMFYHKVIFLSDNMDNEEGVVYFFHDDEETDGIIRITKTHGNLRSKVNKVVIARVLVELACFLTIIGHIIVVNEVCDGYFVLSGFTIWNSFSVTGESLGKVFKPRINCNLADPGLMKIGSDDLGYYEIVSDDLDNNLACVSSKNKVKIVIFLFLWLWFFVQILVFGFRLVFAMRFVIYRCIGKGDNNDPIQRV